MPVAPGPQRAQLSRRLVAGGVGGNACSWRAGRRSRALSHRLDRAAQALPRRERGEAAGRRPRRRALVHNEVLLHLLHAPLCSAQRTPPRGGALSGQVSGKSGVSMLPLPQGRTRLWQEQPEPPRVRRLAHGQNVVLVRSFGHPHALRGTAPRTPAPQLPFRPHFPSSPRFSSRPAAPTTQSSDSEQRSGAVGPPPAPPPRARPPPRLDRDHRHRPVRVRHLGLATVSSFTSSLEHVRLWPGVSAKSSYCGKGAGRRNAGAPATFDDHSHHISSRSPSGVRAGVCGAAQRCRRGRRSGGGARHEAAVLRWEEDPVIFRVDHLERGSLAREEGPCVPRGRGAKGGAACVRIAPLPATPLAEAAQQGGGTAGGWVARAWLLLRQPTEVAGGGAARVRGVQDVLLRRQGQLNLRPPGTRAGACELRSGTVAVTLARRRQVARGKTKERRPPC